MPTTLKIFPGVVFNSNCTNFVVVFQTDAMGIPGVGYALLGDPCQVVYTEVQLLAPNGGEILPSGSLYSIQWGAPSEAVSFKLEYSTNNGPDVEKDCQRGNRYRLRLAGACHRGQQEELPGEGHRVRCFWKEGREG